MTSPLIIPHLEWHIAHGCNFTCESCAHFSNHGHKGHITIDQLEQWYGLWHTRIAPRDIQILGGEPLLNQDLLEILRLTRRMWNHPQLESIELNTNGFLLEKFPELPLVLKETNTRLMISMHGNDPEYNTKLATIRALTKEWVDEYQCDIEFFDSYTVWFKTYHGFGDNMMPYEDNDAQASWDHCVAGQDCFQLLDGNIYKCAPLAYLPFQKEKYNLSNKWDHYLTYKPLVPDSTEQEIIEFFNRKAESHCAMCPNFPQMFKKNMPTLPRRYYSIKS